MAAHGVMVSVCKIDFKDYHHYYDMIMIKQRLSDSRQSHAMILSYLHNKHSVFVCVYIQNYARGTAQYSTATQKTARKTKLK